MAYRITLVYNGSGRTEYHHAPGPKTKDKLVKRLERLTTAKIVDIQEVK